MDQGPTEERRSSGVSRTRPDANLGPRATTLEPVQKTERLGVKGVIVLSVLRKTVE